MSFDFEAADAVTELQRRGDLVNRRIARVLVKLDRAHAAAKRRGRDLNRIAIEQHLFWEQLFREADSVFLFSRPVVRRLEGEAGIRNP